MHIDEKVHRNVGTLARGIDARDFVCYDPKTAITDSGFGKSLFLEGKASAACLLTLDMGCIGEGLGCTEYQISICSKDNGGPYDYGMVNRLVQLAKGHVADYTMAISPHYGSDVGGCLARRHAPYLDGLNTIIYLASLYLELPDTKFARLSTDQEPLFPKAYHRRSKKGVEPV